MEKSKTLTMAKLKPMILIERLSGKVCGHSNTYFAERNGTQYTGTICNPYKGEPTAAQIAVRTKFQAVRTKFQAVIAAIAALTTTDIDAYKDAFKKQKKYKTLRGFIFAEEYKKI